MSIFYSDLGVLSLVLRFSSLSFLLFLLLFLSLVLSLHPFNSYTTVFILSYLFDFLFPLLWKDFHGTFVSLPFLFLSPEFPGGSYRV